MAAITKRLLHFRPIPRPDPYNPRYFSSSSSDNPAPESEPESEKSPPKTQPSFSSYMNDVKSSLQREPNPQNRLRKPLSFANPKPPPLTPPPPSKDASISEIRRNLNEYRIRSAPPPPSSGSGQFVSFQELYKKNVISNPRDGAVKPPSSNLIRDSLRQMRPAAPYVKNQNVDPASLTRFKESLKLKPDSDSPKIGDSLPSSIFGKGSEEEGSAVGMRTAFLNSYKYPDLGEKLKMLRPEKKKGNWFSLQELNDRLARLKEIEADENHSNIKVVAFKDLRDSIVKLKLSEDEKNREKTMQRLEVLGQLGGTPSFMLLPPKGDLVDKYFHPDNMSSAEKLKLELKKVRDEFKMSESDCGSARVQVAQLTTKIKHLSTVLLKKDKHSRKGLQGMVQRRKKLLKYLRRTDWDSYCLVLSKLGLRDNPDAKA